MITSLSSKYMASGYQLAWADNLRSGTTLLHMQIIGYSESYNITEYVIIIGF